MKRPKAIGKFVIVQLVEEESGTILIPDVVKGAVKAESFYRIYDVGPQCQSGVKRGDQIIISTPANTEFDYNKQHYFAVSEAGIAVVIR